MRWDPPSSAVLSPSPRRRGSREEVMDPSMLSELESTTRASRRRLSHDPSSHALKSRPSSPAPRDASPGKPPSSAWVISGFRVHFIQVRCPHPTPPWASLVAQRVKNLPAMQAPGPTEKLMKAACVFWRKVPICTWSGGPQSQEQALKDSWIREYG